MANKQLYWVGSTASNINSFDFNIATNWLERKYSYGSWGYYYTSYAPSNSDSVYFGLVGSASLPGLICRSPCLFGGYSGGSSGGTNCWANGTDPSGTTFNSALLLASIGDYRNNSGSYGGYPFPYFGTGITGDTLTWITNNYTGVSFAGLTLPRTMSPVNLKAAKIDVLGIGVAGSVTQFTTTKNFATSYNGATGSTASYFVKTDLQLYNRDKRSGDIIINGGSYNKLYVGQTNSLASAHNWSSQTITVLGATIGSVTQIGSNNLYFDQNCRVGSVSIQPGWWNGPTYFSGKMDQSSVNNELFVGLSGGTGGTGDAYDSSIEITSLYYSDTIGIRGMETSKVEPYNTPTKVSANMNPTFYFGSPEASISTAKQIWVNSSNSGFTGGVYPSARWAVKFGGASSVTVVTADNSIISASGNSIESELDQIEMPLNKTITIKTVSLGNNSILDLSYNSDYDGWKFGEITDGILSGGVIFSDETAMIKGSKNMNFVNDNTIEGARWSSRFNRFAEFQLPAIVAVPL